jgi:hypothetical protein
MIGRTPQYQISPMHVNETSGRVCPIDGALTTHYLYKCDRDITDKMIDDNHRHNDLADKMLSRNNKEK